MKKNVLIAFLTLTTISVVAFGFKTQVESTLVQCEAAPSSKTKTNPDFVYQIESRFMTTITKEKLQQASSIVDVFPKDVTAGINAFKNTKISLLPEGTKNTKNGTGKLLSDHQKDLLKSVNYSTDFFIRADYGNKDQNPNQLENEYLIYYITVVPETQAEYKNGHWALIDYLKQNSQKESYLAKSDELKPGKVRFTVTLKGTVSNVILDSTSGFQSIDNTMLKLIKNIPGRWHPASNNKGEAVTQEFVFFFGIAGC